MNDLILNVKLDKFSKNLSSSIFISFITIHNLIFFFYPIEFLNKFPVHKSI